MPCLFPTVPGLHATVANISRSRESLTDVAGGTLGLFRSAVFALGVDGVDAAVLRSALALSAQGSSALRLAGGVHARLGTAGGASRGGTLDAGNAVAARHPTCSHQGRVMIPQTGETKGISLGPTK